MNRWKSRWILLLTAVAMAGSAQAQVRFRAFGDGNFTAHLTGGQEVPPVTTRGLGQAAFSVNEDGTEVRFKLLVTNVKDITQAHIHCGPPGVNGPVVVFLFGMVSAGVNLTGLLSEGSFTNTNIIARPDSAACPGGIGSLDDLLAKMRTGGAYANVHTLVNPGGEVRGLIRPPEE